MTKVYVIGTGQYSDFDITAVFSTEELAEEYCAKLPSQDGTIEELELDEFKDVLVAKYWTAEYATKFAYQQNPYYDEHSILVMPENIDNVKNSYQIFTNWTQPSSYLPNEKDEIYRVWCKSYVSAEHAKQLLEEYMYLIGQPSKNTVNINGVL